MDSKSSRKFQELNSPELNTARPQPSAKAAIANKSSLYRRLQELSSLDQTTANKSSRHNSQEPRLTLLQDLNSQDQTMANKCSHSLHESRMDTRSSNNNNSNCLRFQESNHNNSMANHRKLHLAAAMDNKCSRNSPITTRA